MNELLEVDRLCNDSALFDEKFNNLKNFYSFFSEKEVYDFIKIHPGIIVLLNRFEHCLREFFPNAVFELKFVQDLSGTWFDLITLNIWVDEYTFNNGSADNIRLLNREFWPLRNKLGLLGEVLLSKRILK